MSNIVYSIVIPVYNSSRSLSELVERINKVFEDKVKETFEIIFVDDYSNNPKTWMTLKKISNEFPSVHIYRLARNFGKPGALTCGLSQARGRWIITMDDDLQQKPEDIPKLIISRDHDVVIARFQQKNCGYLKKISSNTKSLFDVYLLGKPRSLANSPFKLIKRHVVEAMVSIKSPRPFIMAQILTVTADLVNVDVSHDKRIYGKTQYTFRKALSQFSNLLFNNSSVMLRLMSVIGFVMASISFVLGGAFVIRKFAIDHVVPGWTTLMVVVLCATGIILFCLGILGEYISRLISSSENHPAFVVKESSGSNDVD